jgi:signal transduction histidine kinase
VIVNLLLNAIYATRSQPMPKVTVRAVARRTLVRGRFIEISVTDNGPGIRSGQDDVLFQPFQHVFNGGAGLGLVICRSLVEQHGGDIWHEQGAGGGASFHFTLPQASRHRLKGR